MNISWSNVPMVRPWMLRSKNTQLLKAFDPSNPAWCCELSPSILDFDHHGDWLREIEEIGGWLYCGQFITNQWHSLGESRNFSELLRKSLAALDSHDTCLDIVWVFQASIHIAGVLLYQHLTIDNWYTTQQPIWLTISNINHAKYYQYRY